MKKLFIIPIRETQVLPNDHLYCRVYKGEEVNNFNIEEHYMMDCKWLLELSTEYIQEYVQFYYGYIIDQLDKHTELEGNDYKEVETAIDVFTLLMGIKYRIDYLNWNVIMDQFNTPLSKKLKAYAMRTEDRSLLNNLEYDTLHTSAPYIRYWYNFNN